MKKLVSLLFAFALVFAMLPIANAQTDQQVQTGEHYYSVLFNSNAIPADFENQLAQFGAELTYAVPEIGFAQVKGDASALSKIQGLSSVQVANPSLHWELPKTQQVMMENVTNDAVTPGKYWGLQWDMKEITNNGASYNLGTGSHHTVVGIVDTGVDTDHPDLVKNLLPGSQNFVPAGGFQGSEPYETGDPNNVEDVNGHGSHVASSIAGNGPILGVAPNVGFRSYRVFGKSSAESAWIYKAMVAAANDGVDVISMSLGGFDIIGQAFYKDPESGKLVNLGNDVADFTAYKRAIKYANDKGALVVVAAGNDGLNATNKSEVTAYLNDKYGGDGLSFVGAGFEVGGSIQNGVVTVSATGPDDSLSSYSNYGSGFVDIAAPGGDFTRYPNGDWYTDMCLGAYKGGGYVWMAGTSMATPKVSAVAALLVDKYGKMAPSDLENLLFKKGVNAVSGTDTALFGAGHLNAYNALK